MNALLLQSDGTLLSCGGSVIRMWDITQEIQLITQDQVRQELSHLITCITVTVFFIISWDTCVQLYTPEYRGSSMHKSGTRAGRGGWGVVLGAVTGTCLFLLGSDTG